MWQRLSLKCSDESINDVELTILELKRKDVANEIVISSRKYHRLVIVGCVFVFNVLGQYKRFMRRCG